MASPLEPTPSRDYNAIMFAAAAIPLSPPRGDEPAPDPLRATCRLHGPRSLYTRNSEGYYGTYAPGCNGCDIGDREAEENAAAERVRALHGELRSLWSTEYDRHTTERADSIAAALRAAITALDAISGIIIAPQQYALRMLDAHAIAKELDELLVEAAVRDPYVSLYHHIRSAMERLQPPRIDYAVGDTSTWPIWAAATVTRDEMEDGITDDSR
jgi:hypothetical protein